MQNIIEKIIGIINCNFPNGVRDDFIDANRIFRIYSTECADKNISHDFIADTIHTTIHANGIEFGGRFYFISKNKTDYLLLRLGKILEQYNIAYYSSLYAKHTDFFARFNIFSPKLLKKILQANDTRYCYFEDFCSVTKTTRLDYEIAKIFAVTNKSLSLNDVQSKSPYLPTEKIVALLSNTQKYFPTIYGKYLPTAKIQFDCEEIIAAKRQISLCLDAKGYAAPNDYCLSSNLALNPEIAEKDMRRIIYEQFFAKHFAKRGTRLLPKDNPSKDLLHDKLITFLNARNETTLRELKNFSKDLCHILTALNFALKLLVRVSENLFVKAPLINFDVPAIDEALTPFVQDKIIPLRAVTSFTGFPPVTSYSWNLFMLESFLRKYSRKYSFNAPATNNANIGAIYPKSRKFDNYIDVQATAIAQNKVPLEKTTVENFLIQKGFRTKRLDKVTRQIIDCAKKNFL